MKKNDENILSMANTTLKVLKEEKEIVSTIPDFVTVQERIQALIKAIEDEEVEIKNNQTGISKKKRLLKMEIAELGAAVAGTIQAYADKTNNIELNNNISTTDNQLMKLRDEQFGPSINNIIKATTNRMKELQGHGLEQADIDELLDLMDVWDGKKQEPRSAIVNRKTSNQTQDEHFEELATLFNNRCDNYANKLKRKFPEFYSKYTNARKVIHAGVRYEKDLKPKNPTA